MTQNNIKIAVTGGMGAGKSAVCEIIRSAGLPVFSCDVIYGELCTRPQFLNKLSEEFGNVTSSNGTLDRKKLSSIVFKDGSALKKLNEITHPAIMEELFRSANAVKLAFCEVPLLFENGFEKLFDGVIVVMRNYNERINAIVQRDKIGADEAVLRLKSQFNYENSDFTKYYVIHNDGNLTDLRQNTLKIVENIRINSL